MIRILSANIPFGAETEAGAAECSKIKPQDKTSALAFLKIKRLVLQPMNSRLEYIRDLRMWLRVNGWQMTQVNLRLLSKRYICEDCGLAKFLRYHTGTA